MVGSGMCLCRQRLALVAGLCLGAVPVSAEGRDLAASAARIEAHLGARDGAAALGEARALVREVLEAGGLGVGFATLSEPGPVGYGVFRPRTDNRHPRGTTVVIYAEPFGQRWVAAGPGLWRFDLDVDLEVFSARGRRVARQPGIALLSQELRHKATELGVQIRYSIDAPPGAYVFVTTLRDRHGGGVARFRTDVEITE